MSLPHSAVAGNCVRPPRLCSVTCSGIEVLRAGESICRYGRTYSDRPEGHVRPPVAAQRPNE